MTSDQPFDDDDPIVDPAAAAAGESPVEPSPHQRIVRALLKPGRGQISAAVLLVVLGVAGVTQVRLAGSDDEYAGMRQADLIQALNGLQAASRRNEQDIRDLETTRDALRDNNDKTATALEQARNEIGALGVLAGTLPATGPGVRITVTIPDSEISLNYLLDGIEELRDAGAEAMEINDQVRVVAQTSFENAEGGISVDGRVLTAPFTIDAIGDPDGLTTALRFPGGFVDDLALDDGKVSIKRSQKIEVTVLRKITKPRYAESTGGS
ncbi:DUF881 domain-containing protein [Nocardioides marmoriginsengisoli]|uniref:DUF881 domain-containing protein n=1 Tax=Nocardioides marmoriginsengisoli TaxID=661483 RepID=A0A3N0CQG9_9ACTN|nr:DUF881 domain-containing protein [Nocardioides marmoriginsengisoli]RNL65707.1 DUF881 domain-containing protein [Nocardioides marmoriginsengisoli]